MSFSIFHLVGRHLSTELQAFSHELRRTAIVYSFETTAELIAAWRLARRSGSQLTFAPQAVVWLQSRAGEFQQTEVAEVQTLDPIARPVVVAGCWCEGEPRSGRLLTGVTRLYWHQGTAALRRMLPSAQTTTPTSQWITIHATQYADYQGVAGLCESLGHRTLWQAGHQPPISSEPDVRMFYGWSSWETWRSQLTRNKSMTHNVLLQDFPRPADRQRAAAEGIATVSALPCSALDLEQAISSRLTTTTVRRCNPHEAYDRTASLAVPLRRSA